LLDGGRTAHSRFKIPLDANETSVCNFSPNSAIAQLLRRTKIIIWDECSMIGRYTFEAVDRTFKDVFKNVNPVLREVPFGGRVVVLGGDFRQVLPVVPRGTRTQIVDQCINRSVLWSSVRSFRLTINMRVQQALTHHDDNLATRLQTFADFLLRIGSGTEPTVTPLDLIRIPDELYLPTTSANDLSDWVFGDLSTAQQEDINRLDWLSTKAILTPLNKDVKKINNKLLDRFPGVVREFLSSDTVNEEEDNIAFPVEYINSIESGGFPDHSLKLKIGCPLILLRNLDPEKGLCNGTRLICRSIRRNIIEVTIATGAFANTHHLIPRINFLPTDTQSPVAFKRRQFLFDLDFV
jgi:ATP-dependent DNA helicase PIF1